MTDLFNEIGEKKVGVDLFSDEPKEQEKIMTAESCQYESNLDKFKRCQEETNKALGVITTLSPTDNMTSQQILNPNEKPSFIVEEDGRITVSKGRLSSTKNQVDLMKAIQAQTYKHYGITGN